VRVVRETVANFELARLCDCFATPIVIVSNLELLPLSRDANLPVAEFEQANGRLVSYEELQQLCGVYQILNGHVLVCESSLINCVRLDFFDSSEIKVTFIEDATADLIARVEEAVGS